MPATARGLPDFSLVAGVFTALACNLLLWFYMNWDMRVLYISLSLASLIIAVSVATYLLYSGPKTHDASTDTAEEAYLWKHGRISFSTNRTPFSDSLSCSSTASMSTVSTDSMSISSSGKVLPRSPSGSGHLFREMVSTSGGMGSLSDDATNMLSFSFDVRSVQPDVESVSEALFSLFCIVFDDLERIGIDPVTLRLFLRDLGDLYPLRSTHYHTFHHAFAVTQFAAAIFSEALPASDRANDSATLEIAMFANLVACACHDAGHDGFSNQFHVSCKSRKAVAVFNQSPQENHHILISTRLLSKSGLFSKWSENDQTFGMKLIWNGLLSTDMAKHNVVLADLAIFNFDAVVSRHCRTNAPTPPRKCDVNYLQVGGDEPDATMLLPLQFSSAETLLLELSKIVLHTADISNTVRPFEICHEYALKLNQENLHQVRVEKLYGLPVTAFMDVTDPNKLALGEAGFATNICRPWLVQLGAAMPCCNVLVDRLDQNVLEWKKLVGSDSV